MDFYLPKFSNIDEVDLEQAILTQVLLPQISNPGNDLYKFFRSKDVIELEKERRKKISDKVIPLNPNYQLDTRFYTRSKLEHIKLMQELSTQQASVLQPFARFYLILDPKKLFGSDPTKNAIPIAFDTTFDTNYYQASQRTTARGEAAGIESVSVRRNYNKTGYYDPLEVNAKFYFSSYEVLINKPAVEKSRSIYALDALLDRNGGIVPTFKDIMYRRKLDEGPQSFTVLLEYGWTFNKGVSLDILSLEEQKIIEKFERVYIALTPKKHNVNFNEDGSLIMDVDYRPRIIDSLKANGFNDCVKIPTKLGVDDKLEKKIAAKNAQIKKVEKLLPTSTERERINNNRRLSALRRKVQELIDQRKKFLTKKIIDIIEDKNLFNHYQIGLDRSNPKGDRIKGEFIIGDYENSKVRKSFTKFYDFKKISEDVKNSVKKLPDDEQLVLLLDDSPDDLIKEEAIKETLDKLFNNLNSKVYLKVQTFIFFKDLLRIMYKIIKESDELKNKNIKELPHIILDNISFPMPNGEKFWCNTGDIPIRKDKLINALDLFFFKHKDGNLRDFLGFFKDIVIRDFLLTKEQEIAFPSLSFPIVPFNTTEYSKDINGKVFAFEPEDLFEGDESSLEGFFEDYVNQSQISTSFGCFIFGQSPRGAFENTGIDNSHRLKIFKESFFQNDNELLETGISKLIIGKSSGLLKSMSFTANEDANITEFANATAGIKPGVPTRAISSNFQYSLSATLFGNQSINLLAGYVYVPSYSFGQSNSPPSNLSGPPTEEQIREIRRSIKRNDFEVGGLYRVYNIQDDLNLTQGVYETKINGNILLRDSQVILSALEDFIENSDKAAVIFPKVGLNVTMQKYIFDNFEKIF